jgi:hypothetical protein
MFPTWTTYRPLQRLYGVLGIIAAALFIGVGEGGQPRALGAPIPDRPPDTKAAVPIPFPDGVVDAERRVAFVSSPKGGIQAIQLEDGKVLWTNDAVAGRPWLVAGRRLVARGDRLVVLDVQNEGKMLRQCDAPAYPSVKVPDRCTVSFHLWEPRIVGDVMEAKWYAVANIDRSKGRPFAFEAWTGFNKAVPVGTVRINLDTGRAEVQVDAKPVDVTMGLIPEAAKSEQRLPSGLPEKLVSVWQKYYKDQDGRIAILDGRLVGVSLMLEKLGQEYQKKVVLSSWDMKTGAAAEPVELIKDKAIAIANVALTEDRRHAAVGFGTSAVTIFSLTDGKPVARELKGVLSPQNAFVDGIRLYSVEMSGPGGARSLRAIDLKTGKPAWDRPVQPRSTIPLPP